MVAVVPIAILTWTIIFTVLKLYNVVGITWLTVFSPVIFFIIIAAIIAVLAALGVVSVEKEE